MIILEAFHMHMYLHLYAHFIVRLYIFYKLIKTFIHIKDHFFFKKKIINGILYLYLWDSWKLYYRNTFEEYMYPKVFASISIFFLLLLFYRKTSEQVLKFSWVKSSEIL